MKTRVLSTDDLKPFLEGDSLADLLRALYKQQQQTWPLLAKGIQSLTKVEEKEAKWYEDSAFAQFNPLRMASVAADVNPGAIRRRPCFLCLENLPAEQTCVLAYNEFVALCNPLPIFPEHMTIAHIQHKPQDVVGNIEALLQITALLDGQFNVFFNGATAGASAPDHLHFQACPVNQLPLLRDILPDPEKRSSIGRILTVDIEKLHFYGVKYLLLSSPEIEDLISVLERLIYLLDTHHPCGKDMLNMIVDYDEEGWQVILIPREKHRPDCYYEEEPNTLLVSPGAVEMSGLIITPRKKDFDSITEDNIRAIYDEVSLNTTTFNFVLDNLLKN